MNSPRKRHSEILNRLQQDKDPLETNRTRTSMLLAAYIIEAMKAKGWTKLKLANAMNKKPSVITRWLSGTHNFTSDTLSDIQFVLGVQLLNLEKDRQKEIVKEYFITVNSKEEISEFIFQDLPAMSYIDFEGGSLPTSVTTISNKVVQQK